MVGFDQADRKAAHLGFGARSRLQYKGVYLFHDADAFEFLIAEDGQPMEDVGFIFLTRLGIYLAGFHKDDEYGRSISVYAPGSHDDLLPKMTKFERRPHSSSP
jgi:hypothetical protein